MVPVPSRCLDDAVPPSISVLKTCKKTGSDPSHSRSGRSERYLNPLIQTGDALVHIRWQVIDHAKKVHPSEVADERLQEIRSRDCVQSLSRSRDSCLVGNAKQFSKSHIE
jgi:hypothetical protein